MGEDGADCDTGSLMLLLEDMVNSAYLKSGISCGGEELGKVELWERINILGQPHFIFLLA